MKNIPYIKIQAKNHHDLGFKIGKKLKKEIKQRLKSCQKLYLKMGIKNFDKLRDQSLKFIPATKKYFPELLLEAQGLAQGANIDFADIMVLMCEEELVDLDIPKCTSIAVKTKAGVLIGHNEDWLLDYKKNGLYIINCQMPGHHSLSLSYMGTIPGSSSGLNANGLCFTANSLSAKRFRYGVPIKFQFRAILDSQNPRQAINNDLKDSSICGNTIYGWQDSRILDVEDYFGHHEIFNSQKFLIHTNHPIEKKDQTKENTDKESIKRYNRAQEILQQEKNFDLKTMKKLLKDHQAGICAHVKKTDFWGATIASVIINPKEKWLEVCWSNPCKNKYTRYYL